MAFKSRKRWVNTEWNSRYEERCHQRYQIPEKKTFVLSNSWSTYGVITQRDPWGGTVTESRRVSGHSFHLSCMTALPTALGWGNSGIAPSEVLGHDIKCTWLLWVGAIKYMSPVCFCETGLKDVFDKNEKRIKKRKSTTWVFF